MVISTIIPNFLYLGAARDTKDENRMKHLKITHIYSCAGKVNNDIDYVCAKQHFDDLDEVNIFPFFESSYHFIENARLKKGAVFVHCLAGRSRSPSIILSYLMLTRKIPLRTLYLHVLNCRDIIIPCDGFMKQLSKLELNLLGSNSFDVKEMSWRKMEKLPPVEIKKQLIKFQISIEPPFPYQKSLETVTKQNQIELFLQPFLLSNNNNTENSTTTTATTTTTTTTTTTNSSTYNNQVINIKSKFDELQFLILESKEYSEFQSKNPFIFFEDIEISLLKYLGI